jgi:2-(1,2-epoxy-1,2-dihydrophenyl)acetyl-CoA isomerase
MKIFSPIASTENFHRKRHPARGPIAAMPLARLAVQDELAQLTLDRPEKRNALSRELIEDAREALARAEEERARALLVTGEGPAFCAGGDVGWMEERKDDPEATRRALKEHLGPLVEDLDTFSAPTVAAVHGAAIGAGLGLALACDVTLVAEDATLGATHARLGLTPDAGTSWLVTRAVGPKRALDLFLAARTLEGTEAAELGLATEAVPEDQLAGHALDHASALARGPTQALRTARQLVRDATQTTLHEMLEREAEAQAAMYRTEDQTEGVEAFLEGREPEFAGR